MLAVLDPVRYAAANARVRGRLARLLPARLWPALLSAANPDELVLRLGGTVYRSALGDVTAPNQNPAQIEQALRAYLPRASQAPLKLVQGRPRELLDWLWRRFELDNLKTLLRAVSAGVPAGRIRAALVPLAPFSQIPWPALSEATSMAEVIERLPATYYGAFYARALEPALDRYHRERQLFVPEAALDLAYYRRLLRQVDKLGGRNRREAGQLVGEMVDGQNLLWAFRFRDYFKLSPEEILNYTLQRRLRVDAAVVRRIALGASPPAVIQPIWGKRLPGLEQLDALSPAETLPRLELIFRRYLHRVAQAKLRGYPFHLGVILAYEILLQDEVQDLITIIEGKAAAWPADRIRRQLVGAR